MGRVRCIRPKTDVTSLGRKKASKKLVNKSKVNGKLCITVNGSKKWPRLCHSSISIIVSQECVGVHM